MSEYVRIQTEFRDQECLVAALADIGLTRVETGHELHLYGYQGDRRAQTADVVVRREFLGASANDLGFRRTAAGYEMIVSAYDQHATLPEARRKLLAQRYSRHAFSKLARQKGGRLQEQAAGKRLKLKITLPD